MPFELRGALDALLEEGDIDFYRFRGAPNAGMQVDLKGLDSGAGTLRDPFLGLFDSNCNFLKRGDDRGSTDEQIDREVAGYCIVWFVLEELHIQNLAIHPRHRRRGLGRTLVLAALEQGLARGARTALLEVRRSNLAAQTLYQALGFRQTLERKDYYSDRSCVSGEADRDDGGAVARGCGRDRAASDERARRWGRAGVSGPPVESHSAVQ